MNALKALAREIAKILKEENGTKKTQPYDTQATVKRIENGTAWVSIPGGVDETPVKLTINAVEGDKVQVRVSGGRAWITGNGTAPPTDDKTANLARSDAKKANKEAVEASNTADKANEKANSAVEIAEGVNEHFWSDNTGAHVTEVSQEEWNDPYNPNYHSGGNTLITSQGMAVRNGLKELASFGGSGAVIGGKGTNDGWTEVKENGLTVYREYLGAIKQLAALGFALGNNGAGGTSYNPFATFGVRRSGTIGNWSTSAGENNLASGACSFAEGNYTTASGGNSHTEGAFTTGSKESAHAEGFNSLATADYSHAQNQKTKANKKSQTTIGTCNVKDESTTTDHPSGDAAYGKYALIIGNGICGANPSAMGDTPSNAFTVDWLGRMECGDHNGTLKSIFDIFYPVGSYYETSDSTFDPAIAWGGTWVLETAGLVHVSGAASGDYAVSGANGSSGRGVKDGGEEEVTLNVSQMPSHTHNIVYARYDRGTGSSTTSALQYSGYTKTTEATGGDQPHENRQPYINVYRWHRTA